MVRIWHVPPAYLDNQRLLGEHLELHVIAGAIAKIHTNRKGGYKNHPETRKYSDKFAFLLARHDALVKEMKLRGWKAGYAHQTPVAVKGIPKTAFCHFRVTPDLVRQDIADLKQRWKREGKTGGRLPIAALERRIRPARGSARASFPSLARARS
jgi:hypothetical protein